jgi:ankyrin repeat protein
MQAVEAKGWRARRARGKAASADRARRRGTGARFDRLDAWMLAALALAVLVMVGMRARGRDLNDQLLKACSTGSLSEVRRLLDAGASANARDVRGGMGAVSRVAELFVFRRSGYGWNDGPTPLMRSIIRGDRQITELLVARGANVNARHDYNMTPLTYAAGGGQTDLCRFLVAHGAKLMDEEGYWSPTVWAAKEGKTETALWLLSQVHDPKKRTEVAKYALLETAQTDHAATISAILNRERPRLTRPELDALVHRAAWADSPAALRTLLRAGLPPNPEDKSAYPPLAVATNLEAVRALLAAGADVNARDNQGESVLMNQLRNRESTALLLLDWGADPNARDSEDQSPLMIASQNGYTEVVRKLLALHADPRATDRHGMPVIAFTNDSDIRRMLTRAGATP